MVVEQEKAGEVTLFMINQPPPCAAIIDHIICLCGFAEDSLMVNIIAQKGWNKLIHVTTIGIE
jgi:hypothetical protein